MKKIQIGNRIYTIVDMQEYKRAPELYNSKYTAIQAGNYALPIRQMNDIEPGIYNIDPNMVCEDVIMPSAENRQEYSMNRCIDYSNAQSIADIFANNKLIKNIQSEIITDEDNILNLNITDKDTPEMKALKQAINLKRADKSQYEDRFTQYQNDMRLLTKGTSITLAKLISICDIFDISAELILKDQPDAPNPMNSEISIDLTNRGEDK